MINWHHSAYKSSVSSFLSTHHVTSKDHLHGSTLSNGFSESLSASQAWDSSKINLWLSKLGILSSEENIAHHGQLTTSSKGISIDCSNDWCLQSSELVPPSKHVSLESIWVCLLLHLLNVCTCCKCLLASSQHYCSHRWVLV